MSCCPSSAWGRLEPDSSYSYRGCIEKLGDLEVYRVGHGPRCVLWNYDVFGFDGGRTRQLCDLFADRGFMVLLPDWFRGEMQDPDDGIPQLVEFTKRHTVWANYERDWNEKLRPYALKHGARSFATLGTCWGTYPVIKFCGMDDFQAGVSLHPSHPIIFGEMMLNENQEEALKKCKGSPQLMMPAEEDLPDVKPGGIAEKVLGAECVIIEFNDMRHGWTTRGDVSADPKVDRDVKKAMREAAKFIDKHMK